MNYERVFGAEVVVYVEDEVTRSYLTSLIGDNNKRVAFLNVGGRETVLGMLEDDFRNGRQKTYGVVDRDYDFLIAKGWSKQSHKDYYRLPAHEIENYLLDFGFIATFTPKGIPLGKPAGHWKELAYCIAKNYLFSVAYNQMISDIQRDWGGDYPKQASLSTSPSRDMTVICNGYQFSSVDDMVNQFEKTTWFDGIETRITKLRDHDGLVLRAEQIVCQYQTFLDASDEIWKREFPGKEMFGGIANAMSLASDEKCELARWIGENQRNHGSIPDDINILLTKILSEISKNK